MDERAKTNHTAQVITISTRAAAGTFSDQSGPVAVSRLEEMGATVGELLCLPDERLKIQQAVLQYADFESVSLLLLTGGTGPTPDDVTPAAIIGLLDRRYDGIEAAIHQAARGRTPRAPLSRIIVGARGQTVILALPGSPGGVRDALTAIERLLSHLLSLTAGVADPH